METPSPTDRRQAWVRRSRHWLTVEETVSQGAHTSPVRCSDTLPDVFAEGCAAGKIESWLQDCGPEVGSEDPSHQTLEPLVKTGGSFEDNLSLGAEATVLNIEDDGLGIGTPRQFSLPFLNLGHSMGSSCFSSATSKTASSVSEVLELCAEDAEETLYQLGFGCDEPQVTAHIPARFFSFPSQLRGINFRLFLESQLGRLHQEDPDLSLASRFRQVEVLTAMANAFYSLYSHVSRTPLQKLAPPDASFSPSPMDTKIAPRFFSNVRSEPRSPVERLKDTVSKMCLYTGPSFRSFDLPSPRKQGSLSDLVEAVMDNPKSAQQGAAKPSVVGAGESIERHGDGEKEVTVEGVQNRDRGTATESHTNGTRLPRTGPGPRRMILDPVDPGPPSPEVAQRLSHPTLHSTPPRFSGLAVGAHDVICPQIVESVHQMIFNCPPRTDRPTSPTGVLNKNDQRNGRSIPPSGAQLGLTEESAPGVASLETAAKATEDESHVGGGPQRRPRALSSHSESGCRITVTGWEGDVVSSPPGVQLDCCAYTPTDSRGSQPDPKQILLIPVKHPALGQGTHSPQQGNSFEMEEVHSVEEDPAQPEATHLTASSWPSAVTQSDLLLREESLQSDSSGYAEEDYQTASFS